MRQGQQQNRRGRGRGGRKGQNPLSRSFESSGPDIKIRGTAQHIAEKYMALARDAIGSGDLVLGENYLQHAEHYNRIIMAAQTLPQNGFEQTNGNGQRIARPEGDIAQLDGMGDGYDGDDDGGDGDQPTSNGGSYDQPSSYEPSGQRDHQNQQPQNRNRDNRNFGYRNNDNRNNDNRRNEPRQYEPRGGGGQGSGNSYNQGGNGGPDQRNSLEPRFQDQPSRPAQGGATGNDEQPRSFEPPRPIADNRDQRPGPDARPNDAGGPRGRRRRGRHENGANRIYPPQGAPMDASGEAPQVQEDRQPDLPEPGDRGDGGAGGQD